MLKLTVIGNLANDPEKRVLPSGTSVVTMRVAANQRIRGEEVATFISVDIYGKMGDVAAKYLSKGRKVYLELESVKFQAKDGKVYIDAVAEKMEMLSARSEVSAEESEAEAERMRQMFAEAPKTASQPTEVATPPDLPWNKGGETELPF